MRVLIAEHDHAIYARLLRQAAPELEVLTSGDSAELARQAADCPVWLGQPDLLATCCVRAINRNGCNRPGPASRRCSPTACVGIIA